MIKCAFIGLGNMGYPMARHLAVGGHDTTVFNRTTTKSAAWTAELQDHSKASVLARAAGSPRDAASGADVVFVCVGNDEDVRSVVYGDDGILAALQPGAVLVDHSTASAELAVELDAATHAIGVGFLDCPISGGQAGAENGTLSAMCGGTEVHLAVARPALETYTSTITLVGPAGAGQQTKMVNQILCAGAIQGAAEALAFGQRAGLDMDKVLAAVTKGAAGSWYLSNRGQTMVEDEFDFGFAVDWLAKDLGIVRTEADRLGADMPLTDLTARYLAKAQAAGDNRLDATAVIRQYPTGMPS